MNATKGNVPAPLRPVSLLIGLCLLALLSPVTPLASEALADQKVDAKKADKVTFNFVDVELPTVTRFISEITGKNFIFDERVKGKITIIAPTKLSIGDAFSLFTSVLELKGFTIVPSGVDAFKIIPVNEAKQRGLSIGLDRGPVNESYIAQLIPLRNVSSDEVLRFVQPIVSKDGHISTFGPGNILLVIDSGLNVEKVLSLVNAIDQPSGKEVPETVLLRHASADSAAKIINEGFGRAKRSTGGQQLVTDDAKAVADSRLNALILFGDRGSREAMKSLISLLDVPSPETTGRVNVYFLENADATELAKVLEGIIRGSQPATRQATPQAAPPVLPFEAPGGITVTADKSSNALIVVASPADYQNLLQVIKQLDKRKRQVYVEAMIVEASLDRLRELGVNWRAIATKDNVPIFVGGFGTVNSSTIQSIITGLQGVSTGGIGNLFSFPITTTDANGNPTGTTTINIPQYAALFSLNEFNDSVNVLSTPQILTSDNKEAEILVGENVPFISQQQTGVTTGVGVLNSIVRQDIGIILRITPQITEGDHIRLDIYQEISSLKDQKEILTINLGPSITKRSTKTSVVVRDNQTVVIGGLMQENVQNSVVKIPILGDIPVLGWLFQTKKTSKQKTNLLVFLNPHIIKESERLVQITEKKHKEFQAAENRYAEGELVVKFKDGVSPEVATALIASKGASIIKINEQLRAYRIRLRQGQTVEEARKEFADLPEVEFAEPNYHEGLLKAN